MQEFRTRTRAQALHLLAEECRAIADSFSTKEARAQMHQIADSYDKSAHSLEESDGTQRGMATT